MYRKLLVTGMIVSSITFLVSLTSLYLKANAYSKLIKEQTFQNCIKNIDHEIECTR